MWRKEGGGERGEKEGRRTEEMIKVGRQQEGRKEAGKEEGREGRRRGGKRDEGSEGGGGEEGRVCLCERVWLMHATHNIHVIWSDCRFAVFGAKLGCLGICERAGIPSFKLRYVRAFQV